jgi:cytochrome c peroxidase
VAAPTPKSWVRQPLGWLLLAALVAAGSAAVAHWRQPAATSVLPAPPANFPAVVYEVAKNPPNEAAFELGRMLFYDPRLSSDGRVSCGSCHQQARAFTDGQALALGVAGRRSPRNSPALQNLAWHRSFMADGGVRGLELQALAPLTSAQEMNTPLADALAKLNADSEYRRRFAAIYGSDTIDTAQFLKALAQFTSALTSTHSRYDKHVRHEPGGTLTAAERRGQALFQAKCSGCHATDLFTDESFRNNGLDAHFPPRFGPGAHYAAARRCGPFSGAEPAQRGPNRPLHARWALQNATRRAGALRPRCASLAHPRPAFAPTGWTPGHRPY